MKTRAKISGCPLYKTVISICYCYSFAKPDYLPRVNAIEGLTAQAESIAALSDTPVDQILTALVCETFGVASVEQAIAESSVYYEAARKESATFWEKDPNYHQKLAEKEVLKWIKERK